MCPSSSILTTIGNTSFQSSLCTCTEFQTAREKKMFCNLLINMSTVKPVHNGHPWDLKNVVVMQRVVWKRSVVSKPQTGHYGFRLAVVDSWPLFAGGRYSEVAVRTGLTVHAIQTTRIRICWQRKCIVYFNKMLSL